MARGDAPFTWTQWIDKVGKPTRFFYQAILDLWRRSVANEFPTDMVGPLAQMKVLTERIDELEATTPLINMATVQNMANRLEMLEAGADDFLSRVAALLQYGSWMDPHGMTYGSMSVNSELIVTTGDANKHEVAVTGTGDGWAVGPLHNVTFPTGGTEHYVTVTQPGIYLGLYSMSGHTAGGGGTGVHSGFRTNTTNHENVGEAHTDVGNANETTELVGFDFFDLTAGTEEVAMWVSIDNSQNFHVDHATLVIIQIGRT